MRNKKRRRGVRERTGSRFKTRRSRSKKERIRGIIREEIGKMQRRSVNEAMYRGSDAIFIHIGGDRFAIEVDNPDGDGPRFFEYFFNSAFEVESFLDGEYEAEPYEDDRLHRGSAHELTQVAREQGEISIQISARAYEELQSATLDYQEPY